MPLPRLLASDPNTSSATDGVALVVLAPFGGDPVLSGFPDGTSRDLSQHPLMRALPKIAASGVHVTALIDLADDDSYLVEIAALQPADVVVTSRWKQDMTSPNTLAGLLRQAHQAHPAAALVLALEGHGAGFLPEIDRSKLTAHNITGGGAFEWHLSESGGTPVLPQGSPVLPQGSPVLPQGSPVLPVSQMPLSTWGLGNALKQAQDAGVPKLAAIHFNNCFNMSVEVLHTVAPYADYATGYENYNFFTAGAAYPAVFQKLAAAGSATAQQLAQWFADGNKDILAAKGNHPTVGCVVQLGRLQAIVERIDDLADALLAALRTSTPAQRPTIVQKIRAAIRRAQQFDTNANMDLETPDELTDIDSLATELLATDFAPFKVQQAAAGLRDALKDIKRYGAVDAPWTAPGALWDFSAKNLAMNIFLPDPLLLGLWDWRSPYYLDVNPDPTLPRVQPHIIDFVKVTDWVDFIVEYHKGQPFKGLLPAAIPEFPVFNARYEPPKGRQPDPCGDGDIIPKGEDKPRRA
jgi:hypothetical protein